MGASREETLAKLAVLSDEIQDCIQALKLQFDNRLADQAIAIARQVSALANAARRPSTSDEDVTTARVALRDLKAEYRTLIQQYFPELSLLE